MRQVLKKKCACGAKYEEMKGKMKVLIKIGVSVPGGDAC